MNEVHSITNYKKIHYGKLQYLSFPNFFFLYRNITNSWMGVKGEFGIYNFGSSLILKFHSFRMKRKQAIFLFSLPVNCLE